VNVTGYHNNLARTGENLQETILTPANVNPGNFGKIFSRPVDGQVYAQPLYLSSVEIAGVGLRNVVFVVTEHDSVYAFDADDTQPGAAPLWRVSFLDAAAGVTTVSVADIFGCAMITPELGITGTPVIDPAANTLYVVTMTKERGAFYQRLHALDISSGGERPGSPVSIQASVPGAGDIASPNLVNFYPQRYRNRSGLLLLDGVVYIGWSSHCDQGSYHGWILGYDAATLRQVAVFNATPDGYRGSFWMGGAAPAADAGGNIFVISGNGGFDADRRGSDFGNSFLKLSSHGGLAVADYFTPFNQARLDEADIDLGSSGAVLLPDTAGNPAHPHLLVSAGKEGRIYVLDRDRMGGFRAGQDSQVVQSLAGAIGPLFGSPAYFRNTVYFSAWNDFLKAFPISEGALASSPSSHSPAAFGYPGAVPSISANGASNGIVWAVESGFGGTLHAFDALDLGRELYNSQTQATRDSPGSFVKFSAPVIANGKVYIGTANALAAYGLLGRPPAARLRALVNGASFQDGPVAPGSLVSLFGSNLVPAAPSGDASLSVNGVPAALLFASPGQINAQLPAGLPPGPTTAVLQQPGMPPAAIRFTIASAAPGIFTRGPDLAAAENEDGSLNSAANPAGANSAVTVYVTGLGTTPADQITAMIGGHAVRVSYAGPAPGSPGVNQVTLRVPELAGGAHPLVVSAGAISSNASLISISVN
jgi:uncharacterized protein (TIGR03437 family)